MTTWPSAFSSPKPVTPVTPDETTDVSAATANDAGCACGGANSRVWDWRPRSSGAKQGKGTKLPHREHANSLIDHTNYFVRIKQNLAISPQISCLRKTRDRMSLFCPTLEFRLPASWNPAVCLCRLRAPSDTRRRVAEAAYILTRAVSHNYDVRKAAAGGTRWSENDDTSSAKLGCPWRSERFRRRPDSQAPRY